MHETLKPFHTLTGDFPSPLYRPPVPTNITVVFFFCKTCGPNYKAAVVVADA